MPIKVDVQIFKDFLSFMKRDGTERVWKQKAVYVEGPDKAPVTFNFYIGKTAPDCDLPPKHFDAGKYKAGLVATSGDFDALTFVPDTRQFQKVAD